MTGSGEQKRLPKGTFPPLLTLGDAASLARRLYEHGGGEASFDLLSQMAGNSVSSSTFVKKLAALKSYGLAVEQNKTVTLTDLGLGIAAPTDAEGSASALKTALLRIEIFNRIYERHKGKLLPADEFLRNIIQGEFRVPREIADRWVRSFRESARSAGLLLERPDGKIQVRDIAATDGGKTEASVESGANSLDAKMMQSPQGNAVDVTAPFSASGQSSRLEVSGGRYASFYVPDKITRRDAEKLKGTLTGLIAIIDSLVVEEAGNGWKDS
jgi:hypothetical protein